MKEEDELLKKCGTKNPFMVPEGYFDNFSKELMNKLPEKEQNLLLRKETINYLATYQALDIYGSYVLWIDVQRQSCCRSP